MERTKPPDILYKYSSFDDAKKILESEKIKITPPHKFNDPFEWLPGGYDEISENELKEIETRRKCEFIKPLLDRGASEIDAETFYENDFIPKFIKGCRSDWGDLKGKLIKEYGILCLSELYNNILMWSHYADSHKGIVIGFDHQKLSPPFYHVEYSNYRPKELFHNGEDKEDTRKLVLTKSCHWYYEEEWRSIDELKSLEKDGDKYLFPFPREAIKEVIIGAVTSAENRKEITELVQKNYPAAKIKQAELSRDKFELEINERI